RSRSWSCRTVPRSSRSATGCPPTSTSRWWTVCAGRGTRQAPSPGGTWDTPRDALPASGLPLLEVAQVDVRLRQLLDVDVLEGDDALFLDEPRGAVDVPHPGVVHGDLEPGLPAAAGVDLHVDLVGQVEPPLGLDDVAEQPHHVAVLAVELQLHVGLVLLEILGAHDPLISLSSGWLPVKFQLRRW